jgi:hypothetical protein
MNRSLLSVVAVGVLWLAGCEGSVPNYGDEGELFERPAPVGTPSEEPFREDPVSRVEVPLDEKPRPAEQRP